MRHSQYRPSLTQLRVCSIALYGALLGGVTTAFFVDRLLHVSAGIPSRLNVVVALSDALALPMVGDLYMLLIMSAVKRPLGLSANFRYVRFAMNILRRPRMVQQAPKVREALLTYSGLLIRGFAVGDMLVLLYAQNVFRGKIQRTLGHEGGRYAWASHLPQPYIAICIWAVIGLTVAITFVLLKKMVARP